MHVIVGAGPVGSATARLLAERGDRVRLVSRRGGGPELAGVERVAADAGDADRLTALADGAMALYNCANPPYHRWPQEWPPLAGALLTTAERSGPVLVTVSNLYPYGPVTGPITVDTPERPSGVKGAVRARMWADALTAHRAGRVRVTEARASDFIGPGAYSMLTGVVLAKVVTGARARVPANLDALHSWTAVGDVARTLVTLATDARAWGRAWLVPTAPPISIRAAAVAACEAIGAPAPRLSTLPGPVVWLGGVFDRTIREFREVAHQFRRPFVLDSVATTTMFDLPPTPLAESLTATARALRPAA